MDQTTVLEVLAMDSYQDDNVIADNNDTDNPESLVILKQEVDNNPCLTCQYNERQGYMSDYEWNEMLNFCHYACKRI